MKKTVSYFSLRIGYFMEKRGIRAHVTHGFAVFPEARRKLAEGENRKRVGYGAHKPHVTMV